MECERTVPTIGILYPGDMGSAVGRLLCEAGYPVVTTLESRSPRTRRLCRAAGITPLDSMEEVARAAQIVLSVVLPNAALPVAEAFCRAASATTQTSLYVDLNAIPPASVNALEQLFDGNRMRLVDGAIHGTASQLPALGSIFLSGEAAPAIAPIFSPLVRTRVVGERLGAASELKMLLTGISKGLAALFLEAGLASEEMGTCDLFLQVCKEQYPEIMVAIDRMLPTYPQHAARRVGEVGDLVATMRALGREPRMAAAARDVLQQISASGIDPSPADGNRWTVRELIGALSGSEATSSAPRSADMHAGPGFRIRTTAPRLGSAQIEPFAQFEVPDISDLLNRLYAVDPRIRSLTGSDQRLCATACTVKVFPGDNLMVHKALDVARPGDVIVIDAGGSPMNAVLGDLISMKAKHRGIAGFVVDGLVRDLPGIEATGLPVFARGTTTVGPLHRGPGEINYPICCGGVVVNPGDLVVADVSGIVVIPREIAADLLCRLQARRERSEQYREAVRRGSFSNDWVDRLLLAHGCPIETPEGSLTMARPFIAIHGHRTPAAVPAGEDRGSERAL